MSNRRRLRRPQRIAPELGELLELNGIEVVVLSVGAHCPLCDGGVHHPAALGKKAAPQRGRASARNAGPSANPSAQPEETPSGHQSTR